MADEVAVRSTILEDLASIENSNERQENLVRQINSAYGLLASIPMICRTNSCPYAAVCAVNAAGAVELGERCPIEADLIRNMFISYCNELEVNPDIQKVQAGLIKDLCSIEIQAIRANKLMSYQDFIVEVVDSVNARTGEVYYKNDLHVAVTWSEKLLNQKMRILDALAATPLVKARFLGGTKTDVLMDRLAALKKSIEPLLPPDTTADSAFEIARYESED